jgi:hypothetical protein
MGGVNFTRNRAWWHTAIWDEYGQRHQYLCIIPTIAVMMPMYWYGTFINRALEQNWAAKMYQLEYESKRNRMTHNLIMEHFETHVEKVQLLLDDVKENGFEKAFDYELRNPFTEYIPQETPKISEEYNAELMEHLSITGSFDRLLEYGDLPYWKRMNIEKLVNRRKYPHSPYNSISDERDYLEREIKHVYLDPYDHSLTTPAFYRPSPSEQEKLNLPVN